MSFNVEQHCEGSYNILYIKAIALHKFIKARKLTMKTFNKYIRKDSTALITGASSGMGLEYADQLAKSGCNLLIVSNEEEKLKAVAERLQNEYHVKVTYKYQDLAKQEAANELFDFCQQNSIQVDILINNAGIFFFKELNYATVEKASAMLMLHVYTPTRLCSMFGDEMKKRKYGYILTISSVTATMTIPGLTMYAATKAYLKSFMKSLYLETKQYNVHTTVVCPGAVDTPLYNISPKYNGLMRFGVKVRAIYPPELLVNKALKAMFRKRRCKTPGFINLLWPPLVNAIPKGIVHKIWLKICKTENEKK